MDYTQEFIEVFQNNIKRDGAAKLLAWLQESDFFTAPASSKFHGAYEGGLCYHSLNVYKRLRDMVAAEKGDWAKVSSESIAIIGLLHDVCKVDFYRTEMRNVKVDGKWEQQPYYAVDEKLPYGHGEKSVYIVGSFIRLTREEAMAINWHMGGFDNRFQGGSQSVSLAYEKYPLAALAHTADMLATYIDENRDLS